VWIGNDNAGGLRERRRINFLVIDTGSETAKTISCAAVLK
jgi:hypothetical protein